MPLVTGGKFGKMKRNGKRDIAEDAGGRFDRCIVDFADECADKLVPDLTCGLTPDTD